MTDESSTTSTDGERPKIAVAVSGGGHRATAWALGAVAALVETGLNRDVVSISSVSGGSIANGAVANAPTDLTDYESTGDFAKEMSPTLNMVANVGLFPASSPTLGWVLGLLGAALAGIISLGGLVTALLEAGKENALAPYAIAGAVIGVVLAVIAFVATRGSENLLVKRVGQVAALLFLLYLPLVVWGGAASVAGLDGWVVLLPILGWAALSDLLLWFALRRLANRGKKVADVMGGWVLAGPEGTPRVLGDIDAKVNHVICTTDLESFDQFYFSPRFLYGYREGITTDGPKGVSLATAVQASAALPGGFPPSVIETGPFTRNYPVYPDEPNPPPTRVVVSDGGVYDNMGDQWERNLRDRADRLEAHGVIQEPARLIVVANASTGATWSPFKVPKVSLLFEVLGLLRDQGVQYDVSTAHRRTAMFEEWQTTERTGDPDGLMGTLAMVDRSPLRTIEGFLKDGTEDEPDFIHTQEKDERAREAVAFLKAIEQDRGEGYWDRLAASNASVGTVLDAIGVEHTLDLMEGAYTLAMTGLYVFNDAGSLTPFPRDEYRAVLTDPQ